jgi:hypothetical protein
VAGGSTHSSNDASLSRTRRGYDEGTNIYSIGATGGSSFHERYISPSPRAVRPSLGSSLSDFLSSPRRALTPILASRKFTATGASPRVEDIVEDQEKWMTFKKKLNSGNLMAGRTGMGLGQCLPDILDDDNDDNDVSFAEDSESDEK